MQAVITPLLSTSAFLEGERQNLCSNWGGWQRGGDESKPCPLPFDLCPSHPPTRHLAESLQPPRIGSDTQPRGGCGAGRAGVGVSRELAARGAAKQVPTK